MTVRFESCIRGLDFFPRPGLNPASVFKESNDFHELIPKVAEIANFKKLQSLIFLFEKSNKLSPRRSFIRKLWLFKQMCELFYTDFDLLDKIVINVYEKAINVLKDINEMTGDIRILNFICKTREIIQKVCLKIQFIIANNQGFLKLLSPTTLTYYVLNANPYMVSKIRCLPWIDPEIAFIVSPKHFSFWKDFWNRIFMRNFNNEKFCLSGDICDLIADFMPMDIRGETFLDFFRKKYDTGTSRYSLPGYST
jgi:hypothetical protein